LGFDSLSIGIELYAAAKGRKRDCEATQETAFFAFFGESWKSRFATRRGAREERKGKKRG
jgi:hypothetical protein